jgi:hypothetical protein
VRPVDGQADTTKRGSRAARILPGPKVDELTAKVKVNMNAGERLKEIREALLAQNAKINHIPLHRQVIRGRRAATSPLITVDNTVIPNWR